MNNLSLQSPRRPLKKRRIFFESLLADIPGINKEIFFKFEMWLSLSGGHLYLDFHCKLGTIRIRHHGATFA